MNFSEIFDVNFFLLCEVSGNKSEYILKENILICKLIVSMKNFETNLAFSLMIWHTRELMTTSTHHYLGIWQKIPKGRVLNGQWQIPNHYGTKWFKCKIKVPTMDVQSEHIRIFWQLKINIWIYLNFTFFQEIIFSGQIVSSEI